MRSFVLTLILAAMAVLSTAGCDDVETSDFGGLFGTVGHPAISGCTVEIYNAIKFESLDSSRGRITTTTTRHSGRFAVEISSRHLGRPLIVVARPSPEARYLDYGAPGNPKVAWDAPREPWVAVLHEWLGGEDYVTVNPVTTVAFHSLMRLPADRFGGSHRFDSDTILDVNAATGANFGIRIDPAAGAILPPRGSAFASQEPLYLEDGSAQQSYAYSTLQLAVSANAFAATSADASDGALDFYEALFRDAQDGSLDGQYFDVPVPHLNQVPTVVGRDAAGESRLLKFVSTNPLTSQEEDFLASARDGGAFKPTPDVITALQERATGALVPTRVSSFDVRNLPFSGNVLMTVKGEGFRRTDRFMFRNGNAEFVVDRDSVGVDGEFEYHSDTELRLRIPDFAATTRDVPGRLTVASGSDFRIVSLVLENLPELEPGSRDREIELTSDARVTDRTEPILVNAEIGRVDAAGELSIRDAGSNVYTSGTDPSALDPATNDVYELRVRVANPGPDDVNDLSLDLALSAFRQLGGAIVADTFGGSETGRSVVFADPLPDADLQPGEVARLDYRFTFLDSALGVELVAGAPVEFTPVLAGVSQGPGTPTLTTGDVIGFNRTARLAPVDPDATPALDALAPPVMPPSVTAGESFDVQLDLSATPRSGASMRHGVVTGIAVTITFDGETSVLHLSDTFFEAAGEAGLDFTAAQLDSTGGRAMPVRLSQSAPGDAVILTVQTDAARTGTLTAEFTATLEDPATGAVTTESSATNNTSVVP